MQSPSNSALIRRSVARHEPEANDICAALYKRGDRADHWAIVAIQPRVAHRMHISNRNAGSSWEFVMEEYRWQEVTSDESMVTLTKIGGLLGLLACGIYEAYLW